MDKFVQNTSVDTCTGDLYGAPGLVMDYYDGNTVTGDVELRAALRPERQLLRHHLRPVDPRRAQPRRPARPTAYPRGRPGAPARSAATPDTYARRFAGRQGVGTVINDPDPAFDDCSDTNHTATNTLAAMTGQNIGDLLNARGVTWGWFQGGFAPTTA